MSSPILPTQGLPLPQTSTPHTPAGVVGAAAFRARLDASERAMSTDDIPENPPAEVLDQIAAASRTNEQLHEQGYQLCFGEDEQSGQISIELKDSSGKLVRCISTAEALEIVAGKSP